VRTVEETYPMGRRCRHDAKARKLPIPRPACALVQLEESVGHLDHIRSYYAALNTGDPDRVAAHFTEDAVHYYTRLGPHQGARAIGDNARWAVEKLDGQWWMEHGLEQGDEAVIEWTMTWRDPDSGERRLNRGTEWFRLRDGKIAEVRAYHHGDRKNPRGDLIGFDFESRGYTTLDDWKAPER
jgi:ketosteroid isomerase-like protein